MPWLLLLIAGLLEIVWAYWMKQSEGFTRLTPSLITLATVFFASAGATIAAALSDDSTGFVR